MHQSGFATAILAEDGPALTGIDGEIQIAAQQFAGILQGQILCLQHHPDSI
jgi:hypothetical protein